MQYIEREKEESYIRHSLEAEKASLIVVRGRRRMGKTTLLGKVLNEKDLYFVADRTDPSLQILSLARTISTVFPAFNETEFSDWKSLFFALNRCVSERITLCLDNFHYLVEGSPSILSVVRELFESETDRPKFHLVLCGSSQQQMYKLSHDPNSPLFGKTDADIEIRAFPAYSLQEALCVDAQSSIEHYAVWGGVPRYWRLAETTVALKDAVWDHILTETGVLYEEPARILREDMKDIVKAESILTAVGNGASRLSEIASRLGEPATNLSRPLAKIIDLGYLERDIPFGDTEKNSKKSRYRIADPFLLFYYKLVVPNRSFIAQKRDVPVLKAFVGTFPVLVGYWWEHLCREAVSENEIDGIRFAVARRWEELDVVAESHDHKTLLIGVCRWTERVNGRLLMEKMQSIAKYLPFVGRKKVLFKLFTKESPAEDPGNALLPDDVFALLRAKNADQAVL